MTKGGDRANRVIRVIAIFALVVVNVVLVGLNLDKHGLPPFSEASQDRGQAAGNPDVADDSPAGAGADLAAAQPKPEIALSVAGGVDDWPGGRGPVPDGPPPARSAVLRSDGSVELVGSVPSWEAATEIAAMVEDRLPVGVEAVTVGYTWHPDASVTDDPGPVVLAPPLLYGSGQVGLPPDASDGLDLVARILDENPTVFITVIGHVDDLGDSDENATVAAARAAGVVSYLESLGVDRSRVVVAVAAADPGAQPNDSDEQRAFNRRIEIQFESFLGPPSG